MRGRAAYLRVGLFVLAGTAILIGLVLFLGGGRNTGGTKYESYFRESVQGLDVGAPVKYRGVTIGQVTDIGLVGAEYGGDNLDREIQHADYRLVFVRFAVDLKKVGRLPDTAAAVKIGLRARLASQGLTGLAYIELDFVNAQQYPANRIPWKPRAEYIPSMPSTLSQVQDAAQQIAAKLNRIDIEAMAGSIQGLIGDLRHELADGDTHQALTRAADLLEELRATVQAAEVPQLTADLQRTSGSVRDLVESREVKTLLANLDTATARLSDGLAKLPQVINGIDTTARRAGSSAADVQASLVPLLRDLQATAANLRDTTEALRRYPAQVLLGGPPPRERGR
jgi:ABC-type transporter Mla subunit MlaD